MSELVSVIVPVYNAEKYIQDCVGSILAQTYKNLELILVDDCSTDHSLALIHELQDYDERIRLFCHKKNAGPGAARNTGISNALGEWIFFVDSDDTVKNNMVERMVQCATEQNAECVICNFEYNGRAEGYLGEPKLISQEEYRQEYFENFPPTTYVGSNCNKCYKRSIVEEKNLFFDEQERFAEDFRFHSVYMDYVSQIYIIPEILYIYNQHADSLSTGNILVEDGLLRYEKLMEFGESKFGVYMSKQKRKRYRSGYLRAISNTIFDAVNCGGEEKKIYQDMCNCFASPLRKKRIKEMQFDYQYPYFIVWILMKLRMYRTIVKLFSLVHRMRK